MRQRSLLLLAPLFLTACQGVQGPHDIRPPHVAIPTSAPAPAFSTFSPSDTTGVDTVEPGDLETASSSSAPTEELGTMQERLADGVLELGQSAAKATLTVYTNHSCTYCSDFARTYLSQLQRDFMDKGLLKVRIIPLALKKYPSSSLEAATLLCAAEQGQGLPMHRELFTLRSRTRESVLLRAKTLQFNLTTFAACLDAPDTAASLAAQTSEAQGKEVTLVPTFFLNEEKEVGLPYYADLRGWIEEALRSS
jgi:protein-disulfide isomerase